MKRKKERNEERRVDLRVVGCVILVVGMLMEAGVSGQEKPTERRHREYYDSVRAYQAEDTAVVRGAEGIGWIRSHLKDSWFVGVQSGGQLYYGTEDRLGEFEDRLTLNGEVYLGRRIFPMMGLRMGGGYGYAHGFLSRETYRADRHTILSHGAAGECGVDENGVSLGGYYYIYDSDTSLLIQKWKYWQVGIDVFLDLDFFRGTRHYNPYKRWHHLVYGGVYTRFSLSDKDTSNHRSEMHVGYICQYHISPSWTVYADVRGSMMERLFDQEWVGGTKEKVRGVGDFVLNGQIGISYTFNMRSKRVRNKFEVYYNPSERIDTNRNSNRYYSYHRTSESRYIRLLDSVDMGYRDSVVPTAESAERIKELEKRRAELLEGNKEKADTMALKEIMLNHVLPWEMVFFELDRWDIDSREESKVAEMARIMKAYPDEKFILTGSADSQTGTVGRNWMLSHNRADVVYYLLVRRYGIPKEQLRREYLGGIGNYEPFQLNRCTVIIMDYPPVRRAFEEMKQRGGVGGGSISW